MHLTKEIVKMSIKIKSNINPNIRIDIIPDFNSNIP